ncbi:FixH family protein [Nonomuraea sp. GTA35]|uniref:FixH family protein n=1 Tax=Nonomuraea sp. GTA35 TaxID=1676746 RepID=UPI0035BF21EE
MAMTKTTKRARPARPDPAGQTRTRAFRVGFLVGAGSGLTVATLIAALAFAVTDPVPAAPPPAGAGPSPAASAPAGVPAVHVAARHLGDLKVRVEAQVSTRTYDPIGRASVAMYADMVAMPMAHRTGPITMTEVPGKTGWYAAEVAVPMVGEYDIQVTVRRPIPGEAHARVEVGTERG